MASSPETDGAATQTEHAALTLRPQEVVELLAEGKTRRKAAIILHVPPSASEVARRR